MNKIAIVDLDGVVADNTARFAKAEEIRRTAHIRVLTVNEADSLYWKTAFTPELVALDTPIDGVSEALLDLDSRGYKVIFLTSRPEHMREATLEWLVYHTVYGSQYSLIMKASAFQFVKTTTWKAGMVQTLASLYDAQEVVFVDDEENNCQALREATDTQELTKLWCYHSLEEAVTEIAKG
jgi:phosphoglycolate phosphatase-like HAD superfamily hydrolase